MRNKLFTATIFLTLGTAHAQIGGFLKDLKSITEKAKQQVQQGQEQQQQAQQPQAQQQIEEAQPQPVPFRQQRQTGQVKQQEQVKQQQKSTIDENGNLKLSKSDFKKEWCTTIDTQTIGPLDYRGVKTGDMCGQPDEIIDQFFSTGYRTINSKMPSMQESDEAIRIRSKDIHIYSASFIINPIAKKIYLMHFTAAICATDSSNNLNEGNNFRSALEVKYGVPDKSKSMYDILSAQYDHAKKQAESNRNSAVSVKEAKSAREYQANLDNLSNTMKNPALKKQVAELQWKYKGIHSRNDFDFGVMIFQSNLNPLGSSICQNFDDQYTIKIASNKGMALRTEEIVTLSEKMEKERVNNAPTPKL